MCSKYEVLIYYIFYCRKQCEALNRFGLENLV